MHNKLKYSHLEKGDIVEILAPAYGVHERDLKKICEYIESIDLVPRVHPDFMEGDIICSGTVKNRFNQLKQALYAEDSKAIWCVKGGSGSPQLIPLLSELEPPKQEKLFIAFSDITSIHFFLNQNWGWKTVHGPILWQIARQRINEQSIKQIENLVFGRDIRNEFELTHISENIKPQKLECDSIIGGNLKLVQCSIGTIWQIQPKNKVLLFEDINEKPYQLDRILTHILQSKLLDGASAIIFGDFEGGDEEMDMDLIFEVLKRFANQTDIPVFQTSGIGHTETNYAVWFGEKVIINVNDDGASKLTTSK